MDDSLTTRRQLMAGVLALLLALAGFACVAAAVMHNAPITLLDLRLANWLHLHANDSVLLRSFMFGITQLHSTPGALGLTALAGWWLVRRGARRWMLTIVAAVPGGMLLNVALKHIFVRARPHFDQPLITLTTYSFPSGHTVAATLFYGVLACYLTRHAHSRRARAGIVVLACAMVLLVAGSRLYLGAHYLSDVLAGMLEGCAWLAVCVTGMAALYRRRRTPALQSEHPEYR
jgi:undecaprenyl-diphosphatase